MNEQEQKATATPPAQVSEHAELRRLAEAATRGEWKWWTSNSHMRLSARGDGDVLHGVTLRDGVTSICVKEDDAAYIAAANPAAIIALLDELASLRASAVAATEDYQQFIDSLDAEDKMYAQIDDWAAQSYRRHRLSTRGQQVTAADSQTSHVIWAALRWAKENAPVAAAKGEPVAMTADLLKRLHDWIEHHSGEVGYGYARPPNPHDFSPDGECCTEDEIAAHKAACEAYDKGEYTPERGCEWVGKMHILRAPWGIGSYTFRDEEAADLLSELAAVTTPIPSEVPGEAVKDAERYRWLRECDWFDSELCVLRDPKKALTSGHGLGADCPSRDRLDAVIDAILAKRG